MILETFTEIQVGWANLSVQPTILIDDPIALSNDCTTTRAARSTAGESTVTLEGCSSGSATVQLWDETADRALATVTVTVMSLPSISSSRRIGYRFFKINWSAHSYFVDFQVEWRNVGEGDNEWRRLGTTGLSGPRAIIESWLSRADVRGIDHLHGIDLDVRIVAMTEDEDSPETYSPVYSLSWGEQPKARGHLPDHTMKYDLTTLPDPGEDHAVLGGWIRDASSYGATIWSWVVPSLVRCQGDCPSNSDGETYSLKVEDQCDDEDVPACLPALTDNVEQPMVEDRTIYFVPTPSKYIWTDKQDLDGDPVQGSNGKDYLWIDRVVAHEFGHTYGLGDRHSGRFYDADYRGIMGTGAYGTKILFPADYAYITSVYETHTRNQGW